MKLHSLPELKQKAKKRLGQGYGSGKGGHTSSRGQKGQKTRGSVRLTFTGSSWVWFKRLPFIRGKSRFSATAAQYTIRLSDLERYNDGETVNLETLKKYGLVNKSVSRKAKLRLVGSGKLTKKLNVAIPASATAEALVKKAGGGCSVETA